MLNSKISNYEITIILITLFVSILHNFSMEKKGGGSHFLLIKIIYIYDAENNCKQILHFNYYSYQFFFIPKLNNNNNNNLVI